MVIIAGMVGTVAFARMADRVGSQDSRGRLRVPAALSIATLVLLTSAFVFLDARSPQIGIILTGRVTMTAAVGPVAAVVTDVVHAGLRRPSRSPLPGASTR
jgi:hypothetical protein